MAIFIFFGEIKPDWVTRIGPNRSSLSDPFSKSYTSFTKFVPIWISIAATRITTVKNRLVEFTVSGQSLSYSQATSNTYSSSNGYFRRPTDGAYDSSGNIYGLDLYNHRMQKFNSSLSYQAKTGSYSTSCMWMSGLISLNTRPCGGEGIPSIRSIKKSSEAACSSASISGSSLPPGYKYWLE